MPAQVRFRFIHAADIHLDSPLKGLPAHDPAAAATIRRAPRQAFERMVNLAIRLQVAFLVIAGDLYDGSQKDINTAIFFASQVRRLREHSVHVYVEFGNHDHESPVTGQIPRSDNLHLFKSTEPHTFVLEELKVCLHGQSFPRRDVLENLASNYPAPRPGYYNIGVLHTALGGRTGHNPYAPCSPEQLAGFGYDYWALGHVHQHEIVSAAPPIIFPGNIQGRHIGETGPKGVVLVEVTMDSKSHVTRLITDSVRWHRIRVDITTSDTFEEILSTVSHAIQDQTGQATDVQTEHLHAVRVELAGRTALHGDLLWRSNDLLADLTTTLAGGSQKVWIEQVDLLTQPLVASTAVGEATELVALLEHSLSDPVVIKALNDDINALKGMLPREVFDMLKDESLLGLGDTRAVDKLLSEGGELLRARLIQGEDHA